MNRIIYSIILTFWSTIAFAQLDIISESNEEDDTDKSVLIERCFGSSLRRLNGRDSMYYSTHNVLNGNEVIKFYLGNGSENTKKTLDQLINILETKPTGHTLKIDNGGKLAVLEVVRMLGKKFLVKKVGYEFYIDIYTLKRYLNVLETKNNNDKSYQEEEIETPMEDNPDYQ